MLQSQEHLFSLPEGLTYLNVSYMAPQLKSVEAIGHQSVSRKNSPSNIPSIDFFTERTLLKQRFASLVAAEDYRNIAIIPSVSYGLANVANNIKLQKGDEIIVVNEQFPSNIYIWQQTAAKHGASIKTVAPPEGFAHRGELWNQAILNAIGSNTALVAMPHVHWADGTLFDLNAIRKKTREHNALLVIDGTQSVGALPFSVREIQPDALICAGYKWLLGPYSLGVAYYSDYFNEGEPLEHNWLNRLYSEDFTRLTQYQDQFQEKADRYCVGESSNFILVPMLIRAMEQLLEWQPWRIQEYCREITADAIETLQDIGCRIEVPEYRAHHLFGIYLPQNTDMNALRERFSENNIFVSIRGDAIRVSPHVYNTKTDFEQLLRCF